jgi:hypothetical protein
VLRHARAALVLALAVVLVGCGTQSPEGTDDPTPEPTTPSSSTPASEELGADAQVSLTISSKVAPEPAFGTGSPKVNHVYGVKRGLLVDYRVENGRSAAVLVADGIPQGSASITLNDEPDPLRTFVRPDGDDGLQLTKRTFPDEAGGDFPTTFQARVVAPGASISGRAFVPFPMADFNATTLPQSPTTWRFCLGVFTSFEGFTLSDDGATALVGNTAYAGDRAQRLLCSRPQPLPDGWDQG